MCNTHYERLRLGGGVQVREKDPVKRFWSKVDKSGDCWNWTGAKSHGYGRCYWHGQLDGAHRIAYELLVGSIPEGLDLDHLCRNRACTNPAHLEPVTPRVNLLRGEGASARNAVKTHCINGHEFTPENTYVWNGDRCCRLCRVAATKRRLERDKQKRRPTLSVECAECGTRFECRRGSGGGGAQAICSDGCRLQRRRRQARDYQRRKRAAD